MKRLIGIAALAILAQGAAANDVLYCTEEKGALLSPEESGIEVRSAERQRFKLAFDGMSAKVGGSPYESDYSCHAPYDDHMLSCSNGRFYGFSYNTENQYGVFYTAYPSDGLPTSGDTPTISIFKCDAF